MEIHGYELGISWNDYYMFFIPNGHFNYAGIVTADEWVHVATTMDSCGTVKTYINGLTDNIFTDEPIIISNNASLRIGAATNCVCGEFTGVIDEVYIFNRNLTENEIKQIMERENQSPYSPEISGPKRGKTSEELNYRFVSYDYEGDDIASYIIDWDDNLFYEMIEGPFASGEEVNLTHIWKDKGTFTIKAMAIDLDGQGSDWGEFEVSITRAKTTHKNFLQKLINQFPNAFQLIRKLIRWL
jgi:hypothetical protein